MTTDRLTSKQKKAILAQLLEVNKYLPKAPFDIEFLIDEPKVKNARYIVHNPQQLNALYYKLSHKTLDGKLYCPWREEISKAIADKRFTPAAISMRVTGLDSAQTRRELEKLVAASELVKEKHSWRKGYIYHYPE